MQQRIPADPDAPGFYQGKQGKSRTPDPCTSDAAQRNLHCGIKDNDANVLRVRRRENL